MIACKVIKVKVLVFLVIFAQVSLVASGSSSKSKSKSTKGKASSSTSSSSTKQRSGHQYAPPLILRPSKPDPHFEILDEQRAYYNFGRRLREGRDGSSERKPTKLKEATPTSLSRAKDNSPATSFSKKDRKAKSKPMLTSAESTFMKKSNEGVVSRTKPKFSGSQLISGDGGPLTHSRRRESVEKDGWKILMGPSVAPEESIQESRDDETNLGFTSLTDDGAVKHRTITRLRPRKKAKSISVGKPDKYFDLNEITEPKKTSKFIDANSRDISTSTSSRKKSSTSSASRRNMQVSIPKQTTKHKYAKITKRVPSKASTIFTERSEVKRTRKSPAPQSNQNSKSIRPSQPIKSSLETRYASLEIENDVSMMSPVMTLDTKKLRIEPIGSSAEPNQFTKVSSMSTEHFSAEQEQEEPPIQSQSPPRTFLESRFDPISVHMVGDLPTELVDGNPDEDHHDHHDHFETKTALESSEYPLVRLSASMNYNINHHKDQGGIVTASSFSNQNQDVDMSTQHFPEFSPFSPSHLADIHEPEVKPASFEEAEHMLHSPPPTSPQVEFMGIGSKAPLPPPLHHGPFGKSRLPPPPLHNGRLKSKLPPLHSRFRYPVELPFQPTAQFHGSIAPSENFMATPGWYPHFPVGSNRHPPPPGLHDNLPRPPPQAQAASSDMHPMSHGNGPVAAPAHSHLIIHPTPHHYPHHHHHRHPPPLPPPHFHHRPHFRPPGISPLDVGSGRKAPPPGDFVIEIGPGKVFQQNSPPPPLGVDPDHPAVQHALKNHHQILNDGIYLEPTSSSNIQETTKNYLHNLHYKVHQNALIPLDRRLVYLSMIFSWMFWLTTFYTYYRWYATGNKAKQIVLNVPKDGDNPVVTTRALGTSDPWNFTKVLEYIEIAQKTYEGFDWQDIDCQKRTLCELVQQNEAGETGRKLAHSYVYRFMDALDGVPIPKMIQNYLKLYKEAIDQGKAQPAVDCGKVFKCKFSIKEVWTKAATKKKAY